MNKCKQAEQNLSSLQNLTPSVWSTVATQIKTFAKEQPHPVLLLTLKLVRKNGVIQQETTPYQQTVNMYSLGSI